MGKGDRFTQSASALVVSVNSETDADARAVFYGSSRRLPNYVKRRTKGQVVVFHFFLFQWLRADIQSLGAESGERKPSIGERLTNQSNEPKHKDKRKLVVDVV